MLSSQIVRAPNNLLRTIAKNPTEAPVDTTDGRAG
jgi:hypothetical protein